MKDLMFFGTSILEEFWEAFGRVWGGQNHRFSQFFRCFFDIKFGTLFGEQKIAKKSDPRRCPADFRGCAAVCADLLGGIKGRGPDLPSCSVSF